jgi:hypothetical protein
MSIDVNNFFKKYQLNCLFKKYCLVELLQIFFKQQYLSNKTKRHCSKKFDIGAWAYTVKPLYPDKSGYRTAILAFNQIFDIQMTLAAIFVSRMTDIRTGYQIFRTDIRSGYQSL